jgi:hypothetical protein
LFDRHVVEVRQGFDQSQTPNCWGVRPGAETMLILPRISGSQLMLHHLIHHRSVDCTSAERAADLTDRG